MTQQSLIDIHQYLPHSYPMLMVDTIDKLTDVDVITSFLIKKDTIFVQNNLFQEVGIIENVAQTCSIIVGQFFFHNNHFNKKILGYISGIKKMSIFALPESLTYIRTHASLLSKYETEHYTLCTMLCDVFSVNTKIAQGEINLIIKEN
ncbi:acyl carrier protein [Capnocytophaga catalasegens]|nr:acyl carrier protein [Capnocytophaga catalasegens]